MRGRLLCPTNPQFLPATWLRVFLQAPVRAHCFLELLTLTTTTIPAWMAVHDLRESFLRLSSRPRCLKWHDELDAAEFVEACLVRWVVTQVIYQITSRVAKNS